MTMTEKIANDVEFKSLWVNFMTSKGEERTVFLPKGAEVVETVTKAGDTILRMETSEGWKTANASLIMGAF